MASMFVGAFIGMASFIAAMLIVGVELKEK